MSLDAATLKVNIHNSETEQTIKDKVESQLKLAEYILRGAEDKYGKGSDIYEKIKTEQDELKSSIQSTLDDNNKTTLDEMLKLKLELGDILQVADIHVIHEKKGVLSNKWWDKVTGVNRTEAEEESDELLNKNIEDYTEEEAKIILEHLNNEFLDYKEGFFSGSNENSLSELKGMTKKDIESYQERLIDIIIGKGNGFGKGFIKGFDEEKGYYLVPKNDLTKIISNQDSIKSNNTLIENFLLSISSNDCENPNLIEGKITGILGEKIGKDVILYGNEEGIIDTDGGIISNFFYNTINKFNENLEIETLKSLSWILPDELNKIINQTQSGNQDKNQVLFKITQYIYSLSDSDFVKDYDLRSSFFEEAHNKVTENILRDVLNDGKQVVSFDNIKGYDVKETSIFEQEIQKNGAENIDKLEIASYLGNLEPSTTPEQLVETLGKDNVLYIMLLFKSGELINGFDKVKKVFANFNENNIESFASEYLTSKYFQSADGGELLNNNINKLSLTQKTTLLNIVENNSNICIKCEGGDFEDPITNEILSISKQREISEIYKEKQQEFNDKIVTEYLAQSGLTELPIELKEKLEKLGSEIFDQAKEVIKEEGCAFELIKFIHQHENIVEIEHLLGNYGLDIEKFKLLKKSLTETVTTANVSVNVKQYEFQQNNLQELQQLVNKYPDNLEYQEQLGTANEHTIIIQKKVAHSTRINNIVKIADINDIEEIIEKTEQGYNREEILNYLVKNSENGEKFKEAILEHKDNIKNINEGNYQTKLTEINNIDKTSSEIITYQDYTINNNGEGSYIISDNIGENIKITQKEAEIVENNPEGLKNLIDMKIKLEELNLGFIWNFREELITLSGEILGTNGINTTDKNFIDKNELNKLLNMVLNIAGYTGDAGSISGTYAKVILLNGVGAMSEEKDTNTGLPPLGKKLKSIGFIENKDTLNPYWKANILNNYKIKKETTK